MLTNAYANAVTDHEKNEVHYYDLYLQKLSAMQKGEKENFDQSNEKLLELCEKKFPIAMVIRTG